MTDEPIIRDDDLWAHEMADEPDPPDYPYGADHPVLRALEAWYLATEPYTIPLDHDTDAIRLALVKATHALNAALIDLVPYGTIHDDQDVWHLCYKIRAGIRDVSMKFLMDEYTDSNTDEPNDVEWDVTGLLEMRDPSYRRPDDIRPSYVGNILDGPEEDLE